MTSKQEDLWRYKQEYDNLALLIDPPQEAWNRLMELEDIIWDLENEERNKV